MVFNPLDVASSARRKEHAIDASLWIFWRHRLVELQISMQKVAAVVARDLRFSGGENGSP